MRLTPKDIAKANTYYSIPIYQRLFEWDRENIETLLGDLHKLFRLSNGCEDYYIGMLTATKENELVDGQQRFTVMMLMGCVLQDARYCPEWSTFLFSNHPRLSFTSRPLDDAYLNTLIYGDLSEDDKIPDKKNDKFANKKMREGIRTIQDFFNEKVNPEEQKDFSSYIFNHLSFFISELPSGYSPKDLNKYFERMNTAGKNLEQHEILKVKMLRNLDANVSLYMLLWNKLADTDTLLIRKREDENVNTLHYRKNRALCCNLQTIINENLINGLGQELNEDSKSIISIDPSAKAPVLDKSHNSDSHCALSFPYILLQTLYLILGGNIRDNIVDFFKPNNLLETFQKYLPYEGDAVNIGDIKEFLDLLVKSRLALDICFVRPAEYGYSLDMNLDEDNQDLRNLLMLESMLYVSSSNFTHYRWFGWLMSAIQEQNGIGSAGALFRALKQQDDEFNKLIPLDSLRFGQEIRYWFWRLDFYIWYNRRQIFKDSPDALKIAENYIFRRNRSIEHIAPQTPESDSMMKWDATEDDANIRNCFGNLVMISQGLNSALSNESYEMKTAHVQSYYNKAKSGSIESLKLLVVHQDYSCWDRNTIKEHGDKMYDWLINSYDVEK